MLRNKQLLPVYLFLTVAALIAFWQVNQCDFISYDDPTYVTENMHIGHGITMETIRWAFTTYYASNWHPLTWMSHMLDVQLFGLNPRWHHLINLFFHITNTLLLFFIFHRMTKAPWKSAFVAALFALHPLHVESVAWVAERKDVLSTFFWMITMVAYIHYVEHPRLKNYLAVLIFFVLGLMAKPMLVTLPFVLLLLDYWPLQRFGLKTSAQKILTEINQPASANTRKGKSGGKHTVQARVKEEEPADHKYQRALIYPLLLEKIPFFALTALSCMVTYVAQKNGGSVVSLEVIEPVVRIANASVSYIIYIGKTFWPNNLAVYYPYPGLWPLWQVFGAALLLIAVTFVAIWQAERLPYLAFGWLWFAGTLVPVIGIVQVGGQAMADRYTYIPLIGLFIVAAWGIPELLQKWRYRKEALIALSVLILAGLFFVTWRQVGYWNNSIALYDHALSVTGPNDAILNNRGVAYGQSGNLMHAISDYDRAIEINPGNVEIYNNRGITYGKLGNHRQAIEDFDRATKLNPEYEEALFNRGIAHDKLSFHRQAIEDFDRVIKINPTHVEACFNRGVAYGELGNHRQAIEDFDRVIGIDPEDGRAYFNRAVAFGELGNRSRAIEDLKTAARLNNEDAKNFLRSEGIRW
ncbi:MAG: tetratricopeptide repeat protein [Syntrophobacteraceae bacterium]